MTASGGNLTVHLLNLDLDLVLSSILHRGEEQD